MTSPLTAEAFGLFGDPPPRLAPRPPRLRQFSPLVPGAEALDAVAPGSLPGMLMLAPAGTLERRYTLALMLRALAPAAPFTVLAPKDMGGSRLARECEALGVAVEETAKAHHRICHAVRPERMDEAALTAAVAEGAPRRLDDLGLWSQPGIFSWDRVDPGTALLASTLPPLEGKGIDLGCGIGILAHAVLASPGVTRLALIDIDRRAIEAARRNVDDARADFAWGDVRQGTGQSKLDFVVANPPFHDAGLEDRSLGQAFIREAAAILRRGGRLYLVANRHLPYEAVLADLFRQTACAAEDHGFKVLEAVK